MLHSTDAGEMSVISAYAVPFFMKDAINGDYDLIHELDNETVNTMRWY